MRRASRHYKDVIRTRVVSLRLNEQEFHLLKASGLRERKPMSKLLRARMADLIEGMPVRTEAASPAQMG